MERYEERDSVVLKKGSQKLFAIFHYPLKPKKAPAILICHGLAGHKIGHQRLYVALSECLSRAGIASLRLDFRGSGDSEGDFAALTINTQVEDALLGLDWLLSNPQVDPKKIGIFGRSFGGAVAVLAAAQFKKIKSVALWAPIFDASQWEESWEKVQSGVLERSERHELMRINGQLPSMKFFEELFRLNLAPPLHSLGAVPLLHIHGEKDPVVGVKHADCYSSVRREASGESKFIRLLHGDHDFTHPEEKKSAIEETCHWFQRTL